MRLIFIDTETTGLCPCNGDRIVEIAAIEVVDGLLTGREFHRLLNPGCPILPKISEIHGIHDRMVQDKPGFAAIAEELMCFVSAGQAVMHNARFDTGFLKAEFERLGTDFAPLTSLDAVIDTLPRFRRLHPGQRCTLSALCERHAIELNPGENWHGTLADARMLARLWQKCGQLLAC